METSYKVLELSDRDITFWDGYINHIIKVFVVMALWPT